MATQKIYGVYHTDFRNSSGGAPSEGISLNDLTCTCNNPNIADTSARGISKNTVCQTFGISEEDLERLMLGECAFVKVVNEEEAYISMLQVLSCTYVVVPDSVPEVGGSIFPGIVSFGGGVSYYSGNSGTYNSTYIIVADDPLDDNNGWSFYVIEGGRIGQGSDVS